MIYLYFLFFVEQISGLTIFMNVYLAVTKLFFLSCSTCLFFFFSSIFVVVVVVIPHARAV